MNIIFLFFIYLINRTFFYYFPCKILFSVFSYCIMQRRMIRNIFLTLRFPKMLINSFLNINTLTYVNFLINSINDFIYSYHYFFLSKGANGTRTRRLLDGSQICNQLHYNPRMRNALAFGISMLFSCPVKTFNSREYVVLRNGIHHSLYIYYIKNF